jgi:D-2-hydroxyacid dehydrogenase (NADP+)
MKARLLILTPVAAFNEQLRKALLRTFPDLSIDTAGNAQAAIAALAEVGGLLTIGSAITDELLRSARELSWVQSLGTGVDGIIDRPTLAPNVIVTNARGLFDDSVSECALSLMLALARDIPRLVHNQARRRWDYWTPKLLSGKCVGVVGLGAIGTTLARKCKALGMQVIGISNRTDAPSCDTVYGYDQLLDAVRGVDFLILVAPLNAQTRGLIDRRVLSAMRSSSYLVNLARGAVIVDADLILALGSGTIAGAALDAFIDEPLPPESPLWGLPNVLISPHLGGPNDSHLSRLLPIIERNVAALLEGDAGSMLNQVSRADAPGRSSV